MLPIEMIKPAEKLSLNDWADKHVILPSDSARAGRYESSLTPYVIPFGNAISSGKYKRAFIVMMAQGGKSKTMENAVGWKLDSDPEPILYIGPTKTNVTKVVEPKIDGMIRACETLKKKTVFGQKYTVTKKLIAGTSFRFAWAGSTTEIKADTASMVLVDEVDEITIEARGQGSIIPLADARHKSYPNGITIGASTPTTGTVNAEFLDTGLEHWATSTKVGSAIWLLWQAGTRHEWAWPCPHCKEYFIPRFYLLRWPDDATPANVHKTAFLACPKNGCEIHNKDREWMNARGTEVSPGQKIYKNGRVVGEGIESTDFTLWVSGLANPFKTFGELASNWLRAVRTGDDTAIAGVLNTDFGELYSTGGEAPTAEEVRVHATDYRFGEVNKNVRVIITSVDVQKDRLVYVVRGFGYQFESWLIERGEIWGDTTQNEIWDIDLQAMLETEYDGRPVNLMMVDSGYLSQEVYRFCRRNKAIARATKGHDRIDRPFYASKIDVHPKRGKVIKNGLQLWHFCADTMKTWVHGRVNRERDLNGQWWLPIDIDEDYCKQIIAEERIEKASGNTIWKRVAKDNHYLDCEGMAYLGSLMLKSRLISPDKVLGEKVSPDISPEKRIRNSRKQSFRRKRGPSWRNQ